MERRLSGARPARRPPQRARCTAPPSRARPRGAPTPRLAVPVWPAVRRHPPAARGSPQASWASRPLPLRSAAGRATPSARPAPAGSPAPEPHALVALARPARWAAARLCSAVLVLLVPRLGCPFRSGCVRGFVGAAPRLPRAVDTAPPAPGRPQRSPRSGRHSASAGRRGLPAAPGDARFSGSLAASGRRAWPLPPRTLSSLASLAADARCCFCSPRRTPCCPCGLPIDLARSRSGSLAGSALPRLLAAWRRLRPPGAPALSRVPLLPGPRRSRLAVSARPLLRCLFRRVPCAPVCGVPARGSPPRPLSRRRGDAASGLLWSGSSCSFLFSCGSLAALRCFSAACARPLGEPCLRLARACASMSPVRGRVLGAGCTLALWSLFHRRRAGLRRRCAVCLAAFAGLGAPSVRSLPARPAVCGCRGLRDPGAAPLRCARSALRVRGPAAVLRLLRAPRHPPAPCAPGGRPVHMRLAARPPTLGAALPSQFMPRSVARWSGGAPLAFVALWPSGRMRGRRSACRPSDPLPLCCPCVRLFSLGPPLPAAARCVFLFPPLACAAAAPGPRSCARLLPAAFWPRVRLSRPPLSALPACPRRVSPRGSWARWRCWPGSQAFALGAGRALCLPRSPSRGCFPPRSHPARLRAVSLARPLARGRPGVSSPLARPLAAVAFPLSDVCPSPALLPPSAPLAPVAWLRPCSAPAAGSARVRSPAGILTRLRSRGSLVGLLRRRASSPPPAAERNPARLRLPASPAAARSAASDSVGFFCLPLRAAFNGAVLAFPRGFRAPGSVAPVACSYSLFAFPVSAPGGGSPSTAVGRAPSAACVALCLRPAFQGGGAAGRFSPPSRALSVSCFAFPAG